MAERVQATEAARRFSDLVNRVRYGGESFVIVRNGEEVCKLVPTETKVSLKDLVEIVQAHKVDSEFSTDLAEIQSDQPSMPGDPWDSSSTPAF